MKPFPDRERATERERERERIVESVCLDAYVCVAGQYVVIAVDAAAVTKESMCGGYESYELFLFLLLLQRSDTN